MMATIVAQDGGAPGTIGQRGRAVQLALRWLFPAALVVALAATVGAMRHASVTFDETFMLTAGARGSRTGRVEAMQHPPLAPALYGVPVRLSGPSYPVEPRSGWPGRAEFTFGQAMLWLSGNDPERLAFRARLVAAILATLLSALVYVWSWRAFGPAVALVAGILVAFLPDVLAHGGLAYNDVPLTLAFLAALWAIDAAIRDPRPGAAALAGCAAALALAVKYQALALAPVALVLAALEASARGRDRRWARSLAAALPIALLAGYVLLVLIYRGDLALADFRAKLAFSVGHTAGRLLTPAYLLGRTSEDGFWYFFPVAFLFKTPAALHALMLLAAAGFWLTRGRAGWRERLASPLWAPVVALLVLGGFLVTAKLNIGFRHALPALPFLCVLVAVGVVRLWGLVARGVRLAVVALVLWYVGSSLSYYPHFLAYTSEYAPSRDRGYEVLVDSSLDWGQELLHLREFMRENRIPRVYLSYFGSALPGGYGIDYAPLPSFLELEPRPERPGQPEPDWVVISATHLAGVYVSGDPFARFRGVKPDHVLGHSLFVYRLGR